MNNMYDQHASMSEEMILSKRQMQVLSLLADGMLKKEIATQLDISYTTVDTHIKEVYGKLKVNNAPAAISQAYQQGLLKIGER